MEAAANANGEAKKAKIETPEVKKRKGGRSRKKDSSEDEERDEEQEDCSAKPKCLNFCQHGNRQYGKPRL